jgi:hypothetical protein
LSQTLVRVAQDGRGGDWEARIVVGSDTVIPPAEASYGTSSR